MFYSWCLPGRFLHCKNQWLGAGGTINEPEIKFECCNKTVPLCVESLQPEFEALGKVCVLRIFKVKHPQRKKNGYSYCIGVMKDVGQVNQNNLCWETR